MDVREKLFDLRFHISIAYTTHGRFREENECRGEGSVKRREYGKHLTLYAVPRD